jgi:streptogramin lyase
VPIYAAGEAGDELYIGMRYVEGRDLKELLREGRLDKERAVRICAQVADALDFAHSRQLVHRDVKPSNVLLDATEHVYLADFGLTKRTDDARTLEPGLFGTIDYVAPEQIRGEDVDGRADVYALGCLLYESMSGTAPFRRGSDAATLYAHLEEEPPTLPGLEEVLRKALAKERDDRYATCGELIGDARSALGIAAPHRNRLPLAIALAGLAVIAAALLAVFLTGGSSPPAAGVGRLLRIDTGSNRVTASHVVGDGPVAVAAGSGRVWVASYRDGTLWQVEPASGETVKIPAIGRPFDVTVHGGYAYVAALGPSDFSGNVSQFDAVGTQRTGGIGGFLACSLTSGAYGIWVAGCPNVQQLSVSGNHMRIDATVPIPYPQRLSAGNFREALAGMATGDGAIWVVGDANDRRLWRIDPRTRRIVATIALGFPPAKVAAGAGGVWITDQLRDRVVELDPRTYRAVRSVPVARGPVGVTISGGSVWVAGAIGHAVTRIDARNGRVVATIPVAASPQSVAVDGESVWVVGDAR